MDGAAPRMPGAPPARRPDPWAWLRRHLFASAFDTALTLALIALLVTIVPPLWRWAVWHAVAVPDVAACRAAAGHGACWGVVVEKGRLILFGRYPAAEQWRPLLASALLLALLVASCLPACWRRSLPLAWAAVLAVFWGLMRGGVAGLAPVETAQWGGLPLTLILSTVSLAAAFPLAVALALGRQSSLPVLRALCVAFVELVRGVPLVSVLFMASFMVPLFMPQGVKIDVLLRVAAGMTLFGAAYLAEVIRGGLQSVPAGPVEAARALGLRNGQVMGAIVLPQALRAVVPALVNSFVAAFKDTSLVTIVSMYDLTGALQLALGDAQWRRFFLEGQLFVAAVYFVFCFAMARYSRWLEGRLNAGTRREGEPG